MEVEKKPTVSEMVKGAIRDLGGATTNSAVRAWIQERFPGTKRSTINSQLIAGCVNHPSRVHYNIDPRPRPADNRDLDRYFRTARGHVEEYDPIRHGQWEIFRHSGGQLSVRRSPRDWTSTAASSVLLPAATAPSAVPASTADVTGVKGEVDWMNTLQPMLEAALQSLASSGATIHVGSSVPLPYACEVRHYEGDAATWAKPARYQTDLLVYEKFSEGGRWIPRVIIECKIKGVTTHDALTYSAKAATHKHLHPYLRYGILIGSYGSVVPARLVRHGAYFDFMAVWNDATPTPAELEILVNVIKEEVRASRTLKEWLSDKVKTRGAFRMIHRQLICTT